MTVEPHILYPLGLLTGLAAGLVDSIAGGGGLITLPMLLAVGLPPVQALGTNKLQSSFGSCTAMLNYGRKGLIQPRETPVGVLFTFLGAAAGALLAQHLPPSLLEKIIPVMLMLALVYTIAQRRFWKMEHRRRINATVFGVAAGLLLGFYDGFFGPGTGSIWLVAIMLGLGKDVTRATALTKVMNFTSNIASLAMFALAGVLVVPLGLTMAAGQVVGARVGSSLAARRGATLIRPVFLAVVAVTTIKVLYDAWAG